MTLRKLSVEVVLIRGWFFVFFFQNCSGFILNIVQCVVGALKIRAPLYSSSVKYIGGYSSVFAAAFQTTTQYVLRRGSQVLVAAQQSPSELVFVSVFVIQSSLMDAEIPMDACGDQHYFHDLGLLNV